jgi:hypothetical protein
MRHLSTNPGKRIRLLMRNGDRVNGHFVKREAEFVYVEILQGPITKYRSDKIRAMAVNPR